VHPYVSFFGMKLPSYWIMSMLGIIAMSIFSLLRRKRLGIQTDDLLHIFLYCVIGAIVGAKLLYLLTMLPFFIRNFIKLIEHPKDFMVILTQGYVFYGGLIGALFMMRRYCRRYSVDFKGPAQLFAGAAPLFHIFGRIGCYLAGCCYGIEAKWGVVYHESLGAPNGIALVPIQLMEAAANLIIFIAVLVCQRYLKRPERSLTVYFMSYAVCRFIFEFFRGDEIRGLLFGLSTSQWISIGVILYCLTGYFVNRPKKTKA
jgi:phosphatidylglycerol:prolipoprotein diacylglycerol transferase